eukprot:6490571-Amphidinium_carterae.1
MASVRFLAKVSGLCLALSLLDPAKYVHGGEATMSEQSPARCCGRTPTQANPPPKQPKVEHDTPITKGTKNI